MLESFKPYNIKYYFNRKLICIFLLGFSSGLPLALVHGSLQAWFTVSGIDIVTIGFLSLVGIPYSYKFIWAPIIDSYIPPLLGRRRGWLLISQVAIIFVIICMSCLTPKQFPGLLAFLGLLLAFLSATQDISYDAYRAENLEKDERGLGVALGVEGYRLAMLASSGFAMVLADNIGWSKTYLIMSFLMLIGVIATFITPEKNETKIKNHNIAYTIKHSFLDLLKKENFLALFGLVILYKLGDAFSHALTTTFLLRGLEFSQTEVGFINKIVALAASAIGIFFGGFLMTRVGLFKSLLFFGILQAITNLLYMWLAFIGQDYYFACFAIFTENLCGGMGTAAFVAFLMSLCNKKFTATQYALLSSLSSVGRIYIAGPVAGTLVKYLGWSKFYFCTFLFALPGILLILYLRKNASILDIMQQEYKTETLVNKN